MNCPEVRDRLPAFLAGDLTTGEADALGRHLAACPGCRRDADELRAVLRAMSGLPAPAPAAVDLPRLYRAAAAAQRRRLRRWRGAALAAVGLTALVLLAAGLRLELRLGPRQVVLSWGPPAPAPVEPAPPAPTPPPAPAPASAAPPAPDAAAEERLRLVQDLVRALAADADARDDRYRVELARLRARLDAVQVQADRRLAAAENDVKALYSAFGTRDKGGE
jgi:hypothetical protein